MKERNERWRKRETEKMKKKRDREREREKKERERGEKSDRKASLFVLFYLCTSYIIAQA